MSTPRNLRDPGALAREYYTLMRGLESSAQQLRDKIASGVDVPMANAVALMNAARSTKLRVNAAPSFAPLVAYIEARYADEGVVTAFAADHAATIAAVDTLIATVATAANASGLYTWDSEGLQSPVLLTAGQKTAAQAQLDAFIATFVTI